jgi:hypothetical protein
MVPRPDPATIEGHIAKAQRNCVLYESLANTQDRDWAVTHLFYAAIHLVQAHAYQYSSHFPASHDERDRYVMAYLPAIEADYDMLRQASQSARYRLWDPAPGDVALAHEWFSAIQAELKTFGIGW